MTADDLEFIRSFRLWASVPYAKVRNRTSGKDYRSASSTLTSKGQTTIPKEVRDHLRLQTGDRIDLLIREDGTVILRPATLHVRKLKGILHRKNMKPVSVDGMNDAIRKRYRALR